jgi:transposase-like protein
VKIRHEFVLKALEPDANISELCREHGNGRETAYKWLERFKGRGLPKAEQLPTAVYLSKPEPRD